MDYPLTLALAIAGHRGYRSASVEQQLAVALLWIGWAGWALFRFLLS